MGDNHFSVLIAERDNDWMQTTEALRSEGQEVVALVRQNAESFDSLAARVTERLEGVADEGGVVTDAVVMLDAGATFASKKEAVRALALAIARAGGRVIRLLPDVRGVERARELADMTRRWLAGFDIRIVVEAPAV